MIYRSSLVSTGIYCVAARAPQLAAARAEKVFGEIARSFNVRAATISGLVA
jgi:hypothetical protein